MGEIVPAMYLRSLELFGFKSFAPRTVMEFHRGVTCVVGPNGCGKSNVLDAIRWVLGEQSAKALRGGEMADVIFSGTDSRAGLGMAEVSMTFAECEKELGVDWNEVTITRRVFRDGSSEYLLNKTPCRLKDIHGLFMDTGIGRSAYSIMEQGKIDQILSSRPEDRRAIFEEAAGITRFKSQRKEALRKLEATEANLLRLDDIIKEVRRQIGSMQRQAAKARRYQTLLAELKTFETHAARQQWEKIEEHREAGQNELAGFRARQAELEGDIEGGESELAARRAGLAAMEERLEETRRKVTDLRSRISNHENRLVFNREKGFEYSGLVSRYQAEMIAGRERMAAAEVAIKEADLELQELGARLAAELGELEAAQVAVQAVAAERSEAERELQASVQELQRWELRVSGLRGQLASVSQQRDGMEARLSVLAGETQQWSAATQDFEQQSEQGKLDFEAAQTELEQAQAGLNELEGQSRMGQMALATAEGELRQAQRICAEKESRLEVLKGMLDSGEGFSAGTQSVLKGLDNPDFFLPAIRGALAEFIEVEPEYVAAVEAVLGANLQAVVMSDTNVAGHIVKTLRASKSGRAVLALGELDSAFEHVQNDELRLPDGALGWLIHKIKAQPEAERLIERLVNFAVVVPDVEAALRLFPMKGWTIVTLQGELLTGDGMLHGGIESGANAAASVLERKNQVQALGKELEELHGQLEQRQQRREALAGELEVLAGRISQAHEARQTAALQLSGLKAHMAQFERQLTEARRRQQSLEGEQSAAGARFAEAAERLEALEAEVAEALGHIETQQSLRQDLQGGMETLRAREAQAQTELNELKVHVATERQRQSSLQQQRQPMEQRLAELQGVIDDRSRDVETYEGRISILHGESEEIEANLGGLQTQAGEAEAVLNEMLTQRAAVAAEVEEETAQVRARRSQLSGLVEKRSRLEVHLSQWEMKAGLIEEHVLKRYQVELREFRPDFYSLKVAYRDAVKRQRGGGSADSESTEDGQDGNGTALGVAGEGAESDVDAYELDWTRVEQLAREIDKRLDAMGPVNIEAIQEYEELEQRSVFLEGQHADLLNSKAELLEVIAKINNTTRQMFAETFEKIRINFQEMFTELFGGGKANLILTDPSDPLESGIEIIAKPPGKQLQSITLLSGGEKTMTAVSLLFSIYMVKPSPFCVLDEMDAPLDESNINRFIKILDRFVGQSQFVVISHNKKTIARADALYGVTMEEHGVSRLVGVKFTRREDSQQGTDVTGEGNSAPVPSVAEAFGKSPRLHSEDSAQESA